MLGIVIYLSLHLNCVKSQNYVGGRTDGIKLKYHNLTTTLNPNGSNCFDTNFNYKRFVYNTYQFWKNDNSKTYDHCLPEIFEFTNFVDYMYALPGEKTAVREEDVFSRQFIDVERNPKNRKPGLYLDNKYNLNLEKTLSVERYKNFTNNVRWFRDNYLNSYNLKNDGSIASPTNNFGLGEGKKLLYDSHLGYIDCSLQYLNYNSANMDKPYKKANNQQLKLFLTF